MCGFIIIVKNLEMSACLETQLELSLGYESKTAFFREILISVWLIDH